MFAVPGIWSLKQCTNPGCGLCWLDPRPVESDIPKFYVHYFTHRYSDLKRRILLRLRSFLYGGYKLATYIPSALSGLNKAKHQIRHMFLNDLKPGELLDVGCGNGTFLHHMHNLGWSATGVDFDPKAIENAKNMWGDDLTVMSTDLAGARFSDNSFDAVTMSHVIEHVPDPVATLIEARRILKTGGRLVVTTPNIRSFGHKTFRDCWWGLDSPRHLQIFSLQSLQKCARKSGFNILRTSTSAANADTFIGGSYGFREAKMKGNCSTGKTIQFNFLRGIRSLALQYVELCRLRQNIEYGEEAILICEK